MLQLSHVPWPTVKEQAPKQPPSNSEGWTSTQEALKQQGNVLPSLAEWRELKRVTKSMTEVRPDSVAIHIAIGCGDYVRVDTDCRIGAERCYFSTLKEAQKFCLRLGWHLTDLI